MHISIVIPCYNEAKRIPQTIDKIHRFILNKKDEKGERVTSLTFDILTVENGSSDNTTDVLHALKKQYSDIVLEIYSSTKGKGSAIRHGITHAKGEWVLVMDADSATDICHLDAMINLVFKDIPQIDIINSSRRMLGSQVVHTQGIVRRILGNSFHFFVKKVFHLPVTDTQNGFKLFKTSVARNLYSEISTTGWVSEVELFLLAKKHRYIVKEIPITWNDVSGSTLGIKDVPSILVDLMRLYWGYVVRRGQKGERAHLIPSE